MHIERHYPRIKRVLERHKSVLVLGPRGTGKTYFLKRLLSDFPSHSRIDLLSQKTFRRYLSQPSLLYDEIEREIAHTNDKILYAMVDEVQRLPVLLNEVHRCIEDFKGQVVFILTGSSARKLKRDDANLLAGRAVRFDFFPITFEEVNITSDFNKVLQWGSLPEVMVESSVEIVVEYLRTYVDTYLTEEIQRESEVRRLGSFNRFLELAAVENGGPVNYSKIGRGVGTTADTVKQYFQILVDTLIAVEIPAWTHSIRRQLQTAPKFFIFDNGVLNALTGELAGEPQSSTYRYGKLFENLVVNELHRQNSILGQHVRFYHYRTARGAEIDLILQKNPHCPPVAVEIKSGTSPLIKARSALHSFKEDHPTSRCIVLCQTPRPYKRDGIEYLNIKDGIIEVLNAANDA